MKKWLLAVGLVGTLALPLLADNSATWQFDANHSDAHFSVKHMGITIVPGDFPKITGTAQVDDQDLSKSSVNATIDVASLTTRVDRRDSDLRSPNWFDVAKFPTMTFQSTKIEKTGDGTARMTGNLTIHGVTKEVTFDVAGLTAPIKTPQGMHRGVSASTKIDRREFGVGMDSPVVANDVTIDLYLDLVIPAPKPAAAQ
jgi:polyisoprenoid-binding protein YceI